MLPRTRCWGRSDLLSRARAIVPWSTEEPPPAIGRADSLSEAVESPMRGVGLTPHFFAHEDEILRRASS